MGTTASSPAASSRVPRLEFRLTDQISSHFSARRARRPSASTIGPSPATNAIRRPRYTHPRHIPTRFRQRSRNARCALSCCQQRGERTQIRGYLSSNRKPSGRRPHFPGLSQGGTGEDEDEPVLVQEVQERRADAHRLSKLQEKLLRGVRERGGN